MDNNRSSGTKMLALGGILVALAVITLFLASILPTSKLSLYALSSFFIAIVIMESGIKAGWLFYVASCLLGFIILPDKLFVLPFVSFFGIYGIVKLYTEKVKIVFLEYAIKLIHFNICLILAFIFMKQFLFEKSAVAFPWWAIAAGLEVIFFIYDYVYTLFIRYYNDKLKKILKI